MSGQYPGGISKSELEVRIKRLRGEINRLLKERVSSEARSVAVQVSAQALDAISWGDVGSKPAVFPPEPHFHAASDITDLASYSGLDVRYYTEAEIDALLAGKSDTGHTHDDRYYTEAEVDALVGSASMDGSEILAAIAPVDGDASGLDADLLDGLEASAFALDGHSHDDLYYTEAEVDALIAGATIGSIDDIGDVDTTTVAPSVDDVLSWDGTNWVPAAGGGGGGAGPDFTTDVTIDGGNLVLNASGWYMQYDVDGSRDLWKVVHNAGMVWSMNYTNPDLEVVRPGIAGLFKVNSEVVATGGLMVAASSRHQYPGISSTTDNGGHLMLDSNGTGNLYLNWHDDGGVFMASGGGHVNLMDGAGKVGVGTRTPSYDLDVQGQFRATSNFYANGYAQFAGTVDLASMIRHTGDSNTYIQFHAADQFRIVTGGGERLEVQNANTYVRNTLRAVGGLILPIV